MTPQPGDTALWAADMQLASLRKMSEAERFQLTLEMSAAGWNLSQANVNEVYANQSPEDRMEIFLNAVHGAEIGKLYRKWRAGKEVAANVASRSV